MATAMRAAGFRKVTNEGGVASCLDLPAEGKAGAKVKTFQTMMRPPPGARTPKWNDAPQAKETNRTFGITADSTPASELISPKPATRFQEAMQASKVPTLQVNNKAPNVMEFLAPDTTFGRATLSTTTAKECLWPVRGADEPELDEEEIRQTLYLKSHGAVLPGEQTRRPYNDTFQKMQVMGMPTPSNAAGVLVAKTLTWRSGKNMHKTEMESELHRSFKAGENRRGGEAELPDTHVFGHPSGNDGESVGALITTGNDDDVEDLTGTFADSSGAPEWNSGIPTIRLDITSPAKVSVSDTYNYGDQGTVATVLAPSKLTIRGVSVADVARARSKEAIKAIFDAAGLGEKGLDFDAVWGDRADMSVAELQESISAL